MNEYPFTAYLTPTGLSGSTNGLIGGVVPGEVGEGFAVFIEPTSAARAMSSFGLEVTKGYLVIGEPVGLGAAKVGDVLDVPELGKSGTVLSVKPFDGLGDFADVEVLLEGRIYGDGS